MDPRDPEHAADFIARHTALRDACTDPRCQHNGAEPTADAFNRNSAHASQAFHDMKIAHIDKLEARGVQVQHKAHLHPGPGNAGGGWCATCCSCGHIGIVMPTKEEAYAIRELHRAHPRATSDELLERFRQAQPVG